MQSLHDQVEEAERRHSAVEGQVNFCVCVRLVDGYMKMPLSFDIVPRLPCHPLPSQI